MLLDSNILIYGAEGGYERLDEILIRRDLAVASITRIETLGYHRLQDHHKHWLSAALQRMWTLQLDEPVLLRAIALRQQRSIGLADAIIAATALQHGLPLVTRNIDDYKRIAQLTLINPFS